MVCSHRGPGPGGSLVDMSQTGPEHVDPLRTGVPEVDAVLESVSALDDAPVDEHPAVFEAAHDRLRRALDGTS